jgi:hypothetical protein
MRSFILLIIVAIAFVIQIVFKEPIIALCILWCYVIINSLFNISEGK